MPTLRDGNVFVVSLNQPGNVRREHMRALLLGVPFEFADGVIVKNVDTDLNDWCFQRGLAKPKTSTFFQPKPGDLGVLLAFMQVWETIVRRRLPYAFILEDDVVANPNYADVTTHEVTMGEGVDYAFVHPYGGFGMYASCVTLAGAEKLVAARERLIALDKPVDLALWNGDVPDLRITASYGTQEWLYVQSTPLNDAAHSQRVAFNDSFVPPPNPAFVPS